MTDTTATDSKMPTKVTVEEAAKAKVDEAAAKVPTKAEVEEAAKGKIDEASASVESAKAQVEEAAKSKVDEASASVESAKAKVDEAAKGKVNAAAASVESAKAQLKEAAAKVELPKGATDQKAAAAAPEQDDGMDHTPTEDMNKLVHFNALEPSHVGTIKDVSASNKLIQRKYAPKDFHWSKSAEIHRIRRKQIVEAHPEILKVQGADNREAIFATVTVLIQFIMCILVRNWSWPKVILATWLVSGTMEHSIVMGGHELSHDMFFKTRFYNRLFSLFLNLPVGVAMMATFRRYHLDHHSSQGVPNIDVDLPTRFEANLFQHKLGKFVWALFQPFFYGLRPLIVHPLPMNLYEFVNWLVQLPFDILVVKYLGWKSFFYLIGGLFMGLSIFNPISAHFIAEHYEFVYGQETYSYYGPLNFIVYNVGLHNEHHDFPNVAGSNLWKVKEIAPEWYDMPSYTSWTKVLYQFITGENMNLYCRVMREHA